MEVCSLESSEHNFSSNESMQTINLAIPDVQRLKCIQSDASVYCADKQH